MKVCLNNGRSTLSEYSVSMVTRPVAAVDPETGRLAQEGVGLGRQAALDGVVGELAGKLACCRMSSSSW